MFLFSYKQGGRPLIAFSIADNSQRIKEYGKKADDKEMHG
jgi:hypothetical protein